MTPKYRVAILDDHQSIIDGYQFRLSLAPEVEVVATACFGEDLRPMLARHAVDVLILDVMVPTSKDNKNPYPILHTIPDLVQTYPNLAVLVISMHVERSLIRAVMEAGASGYILKDDQSAIRDLGMVVHTLATGGIHFSQRAHQQMLKKQFKENEPLLTPRQQELLSLCASYPDTSTADLAERLGVANSTVRNLLSNAYLRLGVSTRAAAIVRAQQLGLISSSQGPPEAE